MADRTFACKAGKHNFCGGYCVSDDEVPRCECRCHLAYLFYSGLPWEALTEEEQEAFMHPPSP